MWNMNYKVLYEIQSKYIAAICYRQSLFQIQPALSNRRHDRFCVFIQETKSWFKRNKHKTDLFNFETEYSTSSRDLSMY